MLNLVPSTNSLLVQYKDSMDSTCPVAIPKKVTFKTTEGTSTYSQVRKRKSKSKPIVVEKDASVKNVHERTGKGGSKKVKKEVTKNSFEGGSAKEVPIYPVKVVNTVVLETSIPEIVFRMFKKLKTESTSSGVVIKDITEKEAQESRK